MKKKKKKKIEFPALASVDVQGQPIADALVLHVRYGPSIRIALILKQESYFKQVCFSKLFSVQHRRSVYTWLEFTVY